MAFTPDGKQLVVKSLSSSFLPDPAKGDRKSSVSILDANDGSLLQTVAGPLSDGKKFNGPDVFALTPDGRYLVLIPTGDTHLLALYDTSDWSIARTTRLLATSNRLAISPDSKTFVMGAGQGRLIFCSIPELICGEPFHAFPSNIDSFAFSPDGKRVAVVSYYAFGNRLLGSPSEAELKQLEAEQWKANHQRVRVFDVASRALIGVIEGEIPALGVTFHPDGETIVVAAGPDGAYIVDAHTFSIVQHFQPRGGWYRFAAFNHRGDRLALGGGQTVTVVVISN